MTHGTLKATIENVTQALMGGELVVLRTDTLYGIVARANDSEAVGRLQRVRKREPGKAFIVLIDTPKAAYGDDGVKIEAAYKVASSDEPTSVIVEDSAAPTHLLHRDGSLAYRVPNVSVLRELLQVTGPLVAPSANIAGESPSRSIDEAKAYFGEAVACYIDDGPTPENQRPSRVIRVDADGSITQLR